MILTPAPTATEVDDAYLTASEVASLKLDADWVILSACNTASAGTANAETLSGLTRAFFYAGARSLLVSHWSVESEPTVQLIINAFAALRDDPGIVRAPNQFLPARNKCFLGTANCVSYVMPTQLVFGLVWWVVAGFAGILTIFHQA